MSIIAIPSTGETEQSEVNERFGRAEYIFIYDTDKNEKEIFHNPVLDSHGQGPKLINQLASKGIDALITKNLGENAFNATSAAEIKVYLPISGSVKENIEAFQSNKLTIMERATKESH